MDEFLTIYDQAKNGHNAKEGTYADFVEMMEVYDKYQNGRAPMVELSMALTTLGRQKQFMYLLHY